MKVVRSKYKFLVLFIFLIIAVFLVCNKNSDNKTKLEQVELTNKESILPKDLFAIMISDENGNYEESKSNTFPSDGYMFNTELSGCMDAKGNLVNHILTYDTTNNLITVSTDTTVYCYLYFDIILDSEPPTNNSVLINNGDSYTTSTSVTLTLSSTDVAEMCISNTDSCSSWETYATSKSHSLTTGDGTKTVYVWFRDEYGNTTNYVTDTITLDTQAPTSNSVKIKNGDAYTTSTSVTLTLASTGASQMCISNTSSCSSWETYATSKSHTLTTGDGTKTVYVWFRDAAGNQTSYVTDTITLDTAAPKSNSVSINSGATSTTSTSVTLTLSSTGATQMCISNTTSCSSWETYATSKNWTLTAGYGTKTIYVKFRDAAGNTTSNVTDTITYDVPTYVCTTNTGFGTCLKSAKTAGFNSTVEGGLNRYQGTTNVNNHVCFGTSDKYTCTGNTDRYMYRIIGVDSSNRVKLIKKEALNTAYSWNTDDSDQPIWPNSIPYSIINGSSFLTNTTYVPSGWSNKIETYSWKYGDMSDTQALTSASGIYNIENSFSSTVSSKIALMYIHDYYYAYQSGGLNCHYDEENDSKCLSSWIHLSNNDNTLNNNTCSDFNVGAGQCDRVDERVMVPLKKYNQYAYSFEIFDSGGVSGYCGQRRNSSLRPVFYLTTSVKYISGSGTASDPFIIS